MRDDWPLCGREPELRRFGQLLTTKETSAVVLAGDAGVGKTFFAEHCLRRAARGGYTTAEVTGTKAAAGLPFGAFAHLLPERAHGQEASVDREADLLRRMAASLSERAGPRGHVLFVDDAHNLDGASAALVRHLVAHRIAFVLTTIRSSTGAPDAITGLWKDQLAERIELRGLGHDAVQELLPRVLGGSVDPAVAAQLAQRSQGNMLFLRELVVGALDCGVLRKEHGIWRLAGPFAPSERLTELIEARLESLNPPERALLEVLSHGEPLGPAEVSTLAEPSVTEHLERRGFLRSVTDGRRLEFRLAHPLYGDVLRATSAAFRTRSISQSLATALEGTGARRREDAPRIASWQLESGGGSPELLLAVAQKARWHYDFPLAERMARAAAERGAGFDARLLAADMASRQGRVTEAEKLFAELESEAADDDQRVRLARLQIDNLATFQGKVVEALRVAEEAERRILDPAARDGIRAKRSTVVLALEGPRGAAELVEPLLARTRGEALVWSCGIAAHALGRAGQIERALAITEQGYRAHLELREPFEWYPWIHLFFRSEAEAFAGHFQAAEQLAQREHQAAVADRSEEAQAVFAFLLARIAIRRGHMAVAAERAREAVALFEALGRHSFEISSAACLAVALAALGEAEEAEQTLASEPDVERGAPHWLYPAELLEARGWVAVALGDGPAAEQHLAAASELARNTGDRVAEAAALSALARLGHADAVRLRLDELAQLVEGDLVPLLAQHATAVARRDTADLEALSKAFVDIGADLLAAECLAELAQVWRSDGRERSAVLAEQRAGSLAEACGGVTTPALARMRERVQLTPTERRICVLAQAGRSNKAIAAELFLSVRTVGNHLHHAYQKLGIAGRDELNLDPTA